MIAAMLKVKIHISGSNNRQFCGCCPGVKKGGGYEGGIKI
jgi:hypothetical protein